MNEMETIKILRHTRHDWLNKIQLISGYMSLGKMDKVKEVIQEVIESSQIEAKISNIQLPKFATYLLTYNWRGRPFELKYELKGFGHLDHVNDEKLVEWFESLEDELLKESDDYHEGVITIELNFEEEPPCFNVQITGIQIHKERIESFLKSNSEEFLISNSLFTDSSLTFKLPL